MRDRGQTHNEGSKARSFSPVPRARKSELAIGRDHHGGHEVRVAAEGLASEPVVLLAAVDLPDHDGFITGSREKHAVVLGRGSDAGHPVGVAQKGAAKTQLLSHFDRVLR